MTNNEIEEIRLEAIYNEASLKFVSERLKNNQNVVLTAVQYDVMNEAISFASEELRNNRNIEYSIRTTIFRKEYSKIGRK